MTKGIAFSHKVNFCIPCGRFKTVPIDVNRCPDCNTKFECSVVEKIFRKK